MKLVSLCPQCVAEELKVNKDLANISEKFSSWLTQSDLQNEDVYLTKCEKGHFHSQLVIQIKHEILFELGVAALVDGYKREAFTNFYGSLERFVEYCIRVFLFKQGLRDIESTYKLIKKQSERQVGAFYMLYFNHFRKAPREISTTLVGNRNNTMHNGYIPRLEEVFDWGQQILDYILNVLQEIRMQDKMLLQEYHEFLGEQAIEKVKKQNPLLKEVKIGMRHLSHPLIDSVYSNPEVPQSTLRGRYNLLKALPIEQRIMFSPFVRT